MPRRPSRCRRLATAARWPLGIALTSWRYMWRTTPLRRRELPGSPRSDAPPSLPGGVDLADVQPAEDGAGPFFHRRYRIRIRDAPMGAEALMTELRADLNHAAPTEFARFEKVLGEEGEVRVGDEFVVRMAGPWDGPVRVVERTPTSVRLATLEGHLEAGQIRFSAGRGALLEFTIESWARAGDVLSNVLYERLRMSKEVQLHMWTSMLERVAELSGGRMTGGIEVRTWRVDGEGRLNFELEESGPHVPERGWNADTMVQALPDESPGQPADDGPWAVARRLAEDYRMADPAIVRARWDPSVPLERRVIELRLRFRRVVNVRSNVQVTRVWDEERVVDGRPARVFGYEYATMEGHLEMGRMDYEVWKWEDDGTVEFRLHAHSRASGCGPAWARLGFRLFGRREQVRFYRRCCERMARLTARELGADAELPPPTVDVRDGEAPEAAEVRERLVPRRTKEPRAPGAEASSRAG
jgi:uncharacterized protein (UPF0548 family)